jgi:hypothetical protein
MSALETPARLASLLFLNENPQQQMIFSLITKAPP